MTETQAKQETKETKVETRILYFDNHLPIRIKGEWEECWLGYVDRDFGGEYIRAYRNHKGEYLIWYRFNSPYTDGRSYSTFVGKFRPGKGIDIIDKFPLDDGNWWEGREHHYNQTARGKIQVWLEELELSKVEEFDS